jgi:hypothetical protein
VVLRQGSLNFDCLFHFKIEGARKSAKVELEESRARCCLARNRGGINLWEAGEKSYLGRAIKLNCIDNLEIALPKNVL